MNESGLGIYGTGYRAFLNTARQNTIQDNIFLQAYSLKKKPLRQKTNETIFSTARAGTTTLQSHRSRYVSMQQETRASSVQSSRIPKPAACKNFNCLKTLQELQELYEEQQRIIKDLTVQIEELRKEIQQKTKMTIYEDKLKEKLISSTQRVQVQKSLGIFGFVQDSQQIFATSKTDSIFMPRTISQHNKTDNNYSQLLITQPEKLIDIYSKSLLQNYCYSQLSNKLPLPYIKCDKCELIKNQHIIRLQCKHQYHVLCLLDNLHAQIQKQQETFNLTGLLYCHCGSLITQTYIKTLYQPQFTIIYQIIANLQLFNLAKTYSLESKKEPILKCAKEHCYFIILSQEDKISYCPLCCEFNQFVQIKFI